MLFLSLPKNEPTGTCRINGQRAEYRVHQDHLEFRYEGQEAWDRRRILDASDNGELIQYFCDDGQESEGPYQKQENDGMKNKMMESAADLYDAIGLEAFAYGLCDLWFENDCPPCAAVEKLKNQINQMSINNRTRDEENQ